MKNSPHSFLFSAVLLAFVVLLIPSTSQAAFSFTEVSSYLDGKAYTYPAGAVADVSSAQAGDVFSPLFFWGFLADPIAKCNDYVAYANLPSTADTYCVYDAYMNHSGFGSSFYGSGGSATDTTLNLPVAALNVYQNKITPTTLSAIFTPLSTYFGQKFVYDAYVMMGTTPLPAAPVDPGYRDVCPAENQDQGIYTLGADISTDPNTKCTVYHSPGVPGSPPIASLTVNPGTITQGLSSALTYTCDATATSASINGGIGAVTLPSGTIAVTPTTTTAYILTCTNAVGSSQAQETVTVIPVSTVDLIAGSVTPTTATAGTPTTLNATVTNTGNANSDTFPVLYQVQETGALVNSAYITSVGPGDSLPSSASYTFPSAGTYSVRACANNNTSWVNIATETNYGNNCGPWTSITVAASTYSCTVNATTIPVNGSVIYTANIGGGALQNYTWQPSDNVGSYGNSATANRTFGSAGQYGMSVTRPVGFGSGSAVCPIVTVGAQCGGSPTGTITATQTRVRSGTATSIKVSAVQNVNTSCIVSGPGINYTINSVSCVTPVETLPTPSLTTQAVYTLTCDGVKTSTVIVNVLPNFTEF
jgi:hypothetical protein